MANNDNKNVEDESLDGLEKRLCGLERDNKAIFREIDKYSKIEKIIGYIRAYSLGIGLLGGAVLGVYCTANKLSSADVCFFEGWKIATALCFGAFTAASYINWAYKR